MSAPISSGLWFQALAKVLSTQVVMACSLAIHNIRHQALLIVQIDIGNCGAGGVRF